MVGARPLLNRPDTGKRDTPEQKPISPFHRPRAFIRFRMRAIASRSPRNARYLTDSGETTRKIGRMSRGSAPPAKNTPFHPNAGMSAADATPPTTAPSGKPQNIIPTSELLRRLGAYSDVSEMKAGNAPPSPIPVTNLSAVNSPIDSANGVNSDATAKTRTAHNMVVFLPKRSPAAPRTSAPTSPPRRPAPNTRPNAAGSTFHSLMICGATKAIAWVSKPSIIAIRPHSRNIAICKPVTPP